MLFSESDQKNAVLQGLKKFKFEDFIRDFYAIKAAY
jgi:hypothetical protein